jgi:hypothetical protein
MVATYGACSIDTIAIAEILFGDRIWTGTGTVFIESKSGPFFLVNPDEDPVQMKEKKEKLETEK